MRNRAYLKFRSAIRGRAREDIQAMVVNLPHPDFDTTDEAIVGSGYQPRFRIGDLPEPSTAPTKRQFGSLYLILKRALDISISVIALVFFTFFILPIIAIAIKLDSSGPIFFKQERIGLNRRQLRRHGHAGDDRRKVLLPGRPFKIVKLRTMRVNAESNGPQWASRNDPRVTRVGLFLRRTRLDEIPQFFNVLKGEMSVIGPRPERLFFIRQLEKVIPEYRERLEIKPGITGLAQIENGYDTDSDSVRRKVQLDREYIRKASIVNDLHILLSTVRVVLTGDGAH